MISLNYRDSRPIYVQIKEELKKLIVTGALPENERLPSVRTLSGQLSINPNTIQRAYNELEHEGYIYSVPGKGSFAAGHTSDNTRRREELLEQFRTLADELRFLGVPETELIRIVQHGPAHESGEESAHNPGKTDMLKEDIP